MKQLALAVALCATCATPVLADWHGGGGGGHWGGGGHEWHGEGGGWHGGGGYGGWGGVGGGFLGGVVGGVLGGIFAPAPVVVVPQPQYVPELVPGTPGWYAYCAQKYRSFDAPSGTYLGFDGLRHTCL